jgi:hypothetical protein
MHKVPCFVSNELQPFIGEKNYTNSLYWVRMKGAVLEIQLPCSAGPHSENSPLLGPFTLCGNDFIPECILPPIRHSCLKLMGFGFVFQYF